ncbi:aminomethyl-transferring glycine dehydrogenase subunit GcvPA [Paramuribaculum intestinale]|uniref:Probable glycine dehydrogenase (decarboxylating) subunit 1 n=1 Tax=Paramuribaculum intestinale TaxID=2094151 RepID=A0A2V1IS72_9BACT|nr:aminomethyl-transferring glycine dehydrogenase subunit GcvPA [Paramuribaculum intestinale]MBJ2186253.1 aminomethyl-transferring glycine dehydrogenase subunit GcvPA [Muribaculaceae bacterium]ROS91265.1 aminomethyl-transferring glycine dehydrogenase subunit GcvPA [Muribaculaceae bacterium Isolate-043 (Harlan)]MCX4330107.1 aminomethyl-transferring glycine dehydrogenase subunit GcvPA [Paramuribaculum intestinale]PWB06659.1 aminomethyl-transferring glycine dehydrogenase subunit GcvPA [Paramuribac
MIHHYFPHTADDIREMLGRCGMSDLGELYADVPADVRLRGDYNLPKGRSEKEIRDFFNELGRHNRILTCFAGAGFYHHYTPAVIPYILSRSEFLTAYTPYQPEISQGTLQYIFEYQSMMSRLTGMEVSNASMYDGATATAEAMMMAVSASRKRDRVLIGATVNPAVRRVVATYARYHGIRLDEIAEADGVIRRDDMEAKLADGDVAAVIVATPNFYGIAEDYSGWADACHRYKALLIMNCVPADLALLKSPGEWGADIACGDAQSLGMPLRYGGPYLGFLCASKALIRKMPGRIVGATTDADGHRTFVLTLQAREQHIRRDKATSNICSNQGLMALHTVVYLSLLGDDGLREAAMQGLNGAHYLASQLEATGLMRMSFPAQPFVNEFAMDTDFDVADLEAACLEQGILCGVKIAPRRILIAVTEMQTREEMDRLVKTVKKMKS